MNNYVTIVSDFDEQVNLMMIFMIICNDFNNIFE